MSNKTPNRSRSSAKSILPWWAYAAILAIASLVLYSHTASYGYTELDDSIFIRDFEQYNRQDTAYARSFQRGVFNDVNDTYYRPLLLSSFVFDRHGEGKMQSTLHVENSNDSISRYHWTNIILHLLSVLLLFFVLRQMRMSDNISFIISLVFCLHPALVQAVAWIPGRNDTMLAVFVFAFMLTSTAFNQNSKWWLLPLQMLFLLAAMFTKETALLAAPLVLFLLLRHHDASLKDRNLWILASSWLVVGLIWLFFRSNATVKNQDLSLGNFLLSFIERLPLVLQYFGKILLPFNLAVVPYQEQTTIWFGVAALLLLAAAVYFTRERNWRMISIGLIWFAIFLLPVLLVPKSLNREAYEHRLYLPLIGILIVLAQTDIVRRFNEFKVLIGTAVLAVLLLVFSYQRTELFSNRIVFWESAVATAPESAYCNMMLGARYVLDKVNPRRAEGEALIRKAYGLDSSEKYINYYMANTFWDAGNIAAAEPLLKRELQNSPNWSELHFRLARCAIERKDFDAGQQHLIRHFELNPHDSQGINNLLMVLLDRKDYTKAKFYAEQVKKNGDEVSAAMMANIEIGLLRASQPSTPK